MKVLGKTLLFLFLVLAIQPIVKCGEPLKLNNYGNNSNVKDIPWEDIKATIDDHTVSVEFLSDFGSADITIETVSGTYVTSALCPVTPADVDLVVPNAGTYVITIVSDIAVFTGQFTIL